MRVSPGTAGGTGFALKDGADSLIVATVLDYTNSNPLAVRLTDTAGDYVTAGGGSQYTQGDTDTSITGTVAMMEVGSDTLQPVQGTVADGLLVNLGSNNDVTVTGNLTNISGTISLPTGASTLAEQQSQTTHLATIAGDTTAIQAAVETVGGMVVNLGSNNDVTVTGTVDLGATDNAVLDAIEADTTTIAGAVSGTEMQVDVVSMPTVTVTATNLDVQSGGADLATSTQGAAIQTAVETIDNAISGSEMQVDIVSIAAGDNNIGNMDIVSANSSTLDHGANRDVDTTAEQITSTSFATKFGVVLKADAANTGIIYVGNSDVTAGNTDATDGFPLSAGETITLEVTNSNIPYAIASANNQVIYWMAV